ncbi:MAG: tape measure protein, partial [Bosea sp. (in: a-proteobacteria)]
AFNAGAYFTKSTDDAKLLLARINGITESMPAARAEYRALYDDAQRLRTPLAETLQGYTRIAGAVKELGGTAKQARELNEVILATAKISGVSGQEAAAAARQFAQALGSGVLQGDELRSILENNQELARQLAKGLNVGIGELRKLGEEGKLTADVVANALLGRLPEIRNKLSDVPLTAADAWLKLKTAMGSWLVSGDQVEMKAGAIARAMNAIADGIERSKKVAADPIVVTVRQVYTTEGGAAMLGPNMGMRGAELEKAQAARLAAEQREMQLRSDRVAKIRAVDNEMVAGVRAGYVQRSKVELEENQKLVDAISLGSEKAVKAKVDFVKRIEAQNADAQKMLASGDPQAMERARKNLEANAKLLADYTIGADRKIAEAKKSEANKGRAETKGNRDAEYNELIAHQQRLLGAVDREVKSMIAVEREKFDTGLNDAEQYHDAVLRVEQLGYAERRALIGAQIAATRAEVAKGNKGKLDDLQRLQGQLEAVDDKETESVRRNVDAQRAIVRKWIDERFDALRAFDAAMERMTQGTADLIAEMGASAEQRQFELSLLGQTEQAQLRLTEAHKAELFIRRESKTATEDYAKALAKATTEEERLAAAGSLETRLKAIQMSAEATRDGNIALAEQRDTLQSTQSFWDGFFQSIKGGWKGVRDYVKSVVFDWLIKQLSQQFTMNVAVNGSAGGGGGVLSSVLGSFGGGGGGGGGILGSVLPSIFGSGGMIAGVGSALMTGINSTIIGLTTGGISGAVGGIGAAFAGGGMAAGVGSLIPVIGPLLAIAAIAKKFDGANGTAVRYGYGANYESNLRAKPENVLTNRFGRLALDGDAADSMRPFASAMLKLEDLFAARMSAQQVGAASAAIGQGTSKWYGFKGDATQAI